MATRAQLLARVRWYLQEPTAGHWADADIEKQLQVNHDLVTLAIVAMEQEHFVSKQQINYVSGTREYALASDFMKAKKVVNTVVDEDDGLQLIDLRETKEFQTQSDGAVKEAYYIAGSNIGIVPTPTASGTNNLNIYYYPVGVTLSDSVGSNLPGVFQQLVVIYTAMECLIEDRKNPAALVAMAMVYEKLLPALGQRAGQIMSSVRYQKQRG